MSVLAKEVQGGTDDQAAERRADSPPLARGEARPGQGPDHPRLRPQARHRREGLLPLARPPRARGPRLGPARRPARGRDRPAEVDRRRAAARQADAPGRRRKKVVTANQQRACVDWLSETYKASQRRVCRALGRARSTVRYRRRARPGEAPLVQAIRRLLRDGWSVNLKRARRPWAALGLVRPTRRRKPGKLGAKRGSSVNSCASSPARFKNDVWTCDFLADRTADGRKLKWLSVVDEYTREGLVLRAGRALRGADVRRELARVAGRREAPSRLRCDNGGEFLCEALASWLPRRGGEVTPVAPASPWENGFAESLHSRRRDELLEPRVFESLADAQAQADWFRREYNTVRPHSAPGYQTPKQFSDACDRGLHGRPGEAKKAKRKKTVSDPK